MLSGAMQSHEIQGCKQFLEETIGKTVVSFAYPYGSKDSYTRETVSIVQENRFLLACSTIPGLAGMNSDPFQLPRMQVGDWPGDEFEKRLSGWFEETC
jgi:hypothetical protein